MKSRVLILLMIVTASYSFQAEAYRERCCRRGGIGLGLYLGPFGWVGASVGRDCDRCLFDDCSRCNHCTRDF